MITRDLIDVILLDRSTTKNKSSEQKKLLFGKEAHSSFKSEK